MVTHSSTPATTLSMPSDREIVVERVFNAPRELVFKVFTDPTAIPRWWGPRRLTTTIDKMDVRPGGAWRFVQRGPDGAEYAFRGEYREILPPERLVSTFEFEGFAGHVMLDTTTFEDLDGKTKLTSTLLYESVEDRDGHLQSGMEPGLRETHDRFAELLATLA
jgi:uncharacterized protein YndB with AHSA1/START domain